ncbi:hypothetical protein K525DRAFT_209791 [Schizophyllum commune Loenen D]|nr:hypothetical protein K525DRAFT_209791 [Schizophyllum commune Loenen D]
MTTPGTQATQQDDFNVEGWTCVVTGGSTSIGLAIARAFADNGARVYISGGRRDTIRPPAPASAPRNTHSKGEIILLHPESVTQLVELIDEREESIDVLVNIGGTADDENAIKPATNTLSMTPLKESIIMDAREPKDDVHDLVSLYACISLLSHGLAASHFSATAAFMPLLSAGNTAIVINYPPSEADEGGALCRLGCTPSKAVSVHLTTLVALEMRRQMAGARDLRIVTRSLPTTDGV